MKPDPNYPRMLFHPTEGPRTVYSEEEEAALGPHWSRTILSALPQEEKPAKVVYPEPEPEPEEEPEPEPEETESPAPPAKPKRARPAAHKSTGSAHKSAGRKHG